MSQTDLADAMRDEPWDDPEADADSPEPLPVLDAIVVPKKRWTAWWVLGMLLFAAWVCCLINSTADHVIQLLSGQTHSREFDALLHEYYHPKENNR